MDLIAHFVMGLVLYKFTGNIWVIILSVILDLDHFVGFVYDKKKFRFTELSNLLHLAYRPRTQLLHSIVGILIIGAALSFFMPWTIAFGPLAIHLFLDSIDRAGIYLLPIGPKWQIRGVLPVGYLAENPSYIKKHKRSHIPSLILIIAGILLLLFYNRR